MSKTEKTPQPKIQSISTVKRKPAPTDGHPVPKSKKALWRRP